MLNVYYANAWSSPSLPSKLCCLFVTPCALKSRRPFARTFRNNSQSARFPTPSLRLLFCSAFCPLSFPGELSMAPPSNPATSLSRSGIGPRPSCSSFSFPPIHGLFSWTPLLLLSSIGILLFCRRVPRTGAPVLCATLAFYYFMASYPDWAGISSYGNRFFVSLTVFFHHRSCCSPSKVCEFVPLAQSRRRGKSPPSLLSSFSGISALCFNGALI